MTQIHLLKSTNLYILFIFTTSLTNLKLIQANSTQFDEQLEQNNNNNNLKLLVESTTIVYNKLTTNDNHVDIKLESLTWYLLFGGIVFVAIIGNSTVIFIVATNQTMKSVTNYFLLNLSAADLMISTLNVVFNTVAMVSSHWPFGLLYCKFSNFISVFTISASVFTLTAITCDRYTAILHPLRPRMRHVHALCWLAIIWVTSAVLAMPQFVFSEVIGTPNDDSAFCLLIWPDTNVLGESIFDHTYNIVIFVTTYFVPITTMAVLYYKVGKELWGAQAIGEDVDKQARSLRTKKKIVKMMIVVVGIFAICWFPYHAYFLFTYYIRIDSVNMQRTIYLTMYWLAMSNTVYNPLIIYFMNKRFKLEMNCVLLRVFCCKPTPPSGQRNFNTITTTTTTTTAPRRRVTVASNYNNKRIAVNIDDNIAQLGESLLGRQGPRALINANTSSGCDTRTTNIASSFKQNNNKNIDVDIDIDTDIEIDIDGGKSKQTEQSSESLLIGSQQTTPSSTNTNTSTSIITSSKAQGQGQIQEQTSADGCQLPANGFVRRVSLAAAAAAARGSKQWLTSLIGKLELGNDNYVTSSSDDTRGCCKKFDQTHQAQPQPQPQPQLLTQTQVQTQTLTLQSPTTDGVGFKTDDVREGVVNFV